MQSGLMGGALAVALVALGVWLTASGGGEALGARSRTNALILGLCGAILLFLLTLPARAPFAPGGQLGVGALVGAAFAALMAWGAARPGAGASPVRKAGALGAALAPAAILSLLYRGNPVYALSGALLGQAATLFFVDAVSSDTDRPQGNEALQFFLGVSATLVAGTALAVAQYAEIPGAERAAVGGKAWWTLPALVLGAILIGALVATLTLRTAATRAITAAAVSGGLLALFAARFPTYWPLLLPPGAGFVTGVLVAVLTNDQGPTTNDDSESFVVRRSSLVGALLGPLLLIALLIVAYRLRTGLGIALAGLGYAGAVAVLPGSRAARQGVHLLALAALFRLSYAALDLEATSVYLTAHYALIGMLGGAMLPVAFGLLCAGDAEDAAPLRWPLAVAVVALPAGMLLLWGLRAVAGLLLGLAVGQGFLMLVLFLEGERPEGTTARAALAAPFAALLLLAVAAIQLLPPLAPLVQDLTRVQRALALLVVAAVLVVGLLPPRARSRS